MRSRLGIVIAGVALTTLAVALRVRARERGLLYPDGYEYLLMARGIGSHLTPTIHLGPGGELFVPSVDAALKPLFPALIAVFSPLTGARAAADAITVAATTATIVLTGILAGRLTGSRAAAIVAAAAALVSPALAYWSGFSGPDPLAEALALATALAVVQRRATIAGVLGALCAATRPEWGLLLAAAGLAGLARPATRAVAERSLLTGAFALAAVIVLLRPPLAIPAGGVGLLLGALAVGTALQLGAQWGAVSPRRATCVAVAAIAAIPALALAGPVSALNDLLRSEWPLLVLSAGGVLWACRTGHARPALILLAAVALLGSIYVYRNAGSERYLVQLLPLACLATGFTAAPAGVRGRALRLLGPAAAIALVPLVAPARPRLAQDTFAVLAPQLAAAPPGTLVSVAPDAYGFLLPSRPHRTLRPGTRGLILLDGAQRAYAPGLTACGTVLARLSAPAGFKRANGVIDTAPAVLVRGMAVPAQAGPGATAVRRCGRPARVSRRAGPPPGPAHRPPSVDRTRGGR